MPVLNYRLELRTSNGHELSGTAALRHMMLRVPVVVGLHRTAVKAIAESGETPPPPLDGLGLIDTGASFTSIDEKAAATLNLQQTGTRRIGAADGPVEKPTYPFGFDMRTIHMDCANGIGCDLAGQGLILLIGMDLLSHGILIVNGPDASFSFSI